MKSFIIVKNSFKATHNWPQASQVAGDQVKFLEAEHRHTFHFKTSLEVMHDDRDVEFFVFQAQVREAFNDLYGPRPEGIELAYRLGRKSCEMLGKEVIAKLREKYSYNQSIMCEVWEDNEVGALTQDLRD